MSSALDSLSAHEPNKDIQKPNLAIVAEGGAMCSRLVEGKITPDTSVVEKLIEQIPPKLREKFNQLEVLFPDEGLVLSSNVSTVRLMQLVNRVRNALEDSMNDHVLVITGSWKASQYAAAMNLGISPGILGTGNEDVTDQQSKSLILLANPEIPSDSDVPQEVLNSALYLSTRRSMGGRAGALLSPDRLYAMPGLLRTESGKILSRYSSIADRQGQGNKWFFGRSLMGEDRPIGSDKDFHLHSGVKTLKLDDNDDAGPEKALIAKTEELFSQRDITGLVVRTQNRNDPFESLCNDFLKRLDNIGIPVVLVNDSLEQMKEPMSPHMKDFEKLVDGRRLLGPEAKILLAHALHEAHGIPSSDGFMQHIRQRFAEHPFR